MPAATSRMTAGITVQADHRARHRSRRPSTTRTARSATSRWPRPSPSPWSRAPSATRVPNFASVCLRQRQPGQTFNRPAGALGHRLRPAARRPHPRAALDPAIVGADIESVAVQVRRRLDHQHDLEQHRPARRHADRRLPGRHTDRRHRHHHAITQDCGHVHRHLQAVADRRRGRHHLQRQLHATPTCRPASTRRTSRSLQFQFEQPCCRASASRSTSCAPTTPAASSTPAVAQHQRRPSEGILITRIRFDQQRAEFERNVNLMLLNVEVAYWNLYAPTGTCTPRAACGRPTRPGRSARPSYQAGRDRHRRPGPDPRPVRAVPRPAPARPSTTRAGERAAAAGPDGPADRGRHAGWCPATRRRWRRTSPTGTPPCTRPSNCGPS